MIDKPYHIDLPRRDSRGPSNQGDSGSGLGAVVPLVLAGWLIFAATRCSKDKDPATEPAAPTTPKVEPTVTHGASGDLGQLMIPERHA